MPQRRKGSSTVSQINGQHRRTLGRWVNSRGNLEPKKFVLPREAQAAQFANQLLERLWEQVERQWARRQEEAGRAAQSVHFDQLPPGTVHHDASTLKPQWTPDTLELAEAARKGQTAASIARRPDETTIQYTQRIGRLRQDYPAITAIAADETAQAEGQEKITQASKNYLSVANALHRSAVPEAGPLSMHGQMLYPALEAYATWATAKNPNEGGRKEAERARRLKQSLRDMDLGLLDGTAIEEAARYWQARPVARTHASRRKPRPISLNTVDHQLKTLRRFLRWLARSEAYRWQMPEHAIESTQVPLTMIRTAEETARLARGPQTFSVEHLAVIWRHASDSERLMIALALNAAMAPAELCGLRWDEIEEGTIKRIRRKSGVYAEFALWPETLQGLAWWERIRGRQGELVLTTQAGGPFDRQRISNMWGKLRERIGGTGGDEVQWWLPFKHVRKTAAHLVRQAADGEIAGVFLSHGQPVRQDELSDLYSRRPFDKVAKALAKVRHRLDPVFEGVDAFTSTQVGGRGPRSRETA